MLVRALKRALKPRMRPLNESGAVAVYVALVATVTLGVVGLAIDASRAMVVHSESQSAADAAALAAASQLDGTPTAITRARQAVQNLVSNNQRLASGGAGAVAVPAANILFLSALPASDDTAVSAFTTDPLRARFVQVTTSPLAHQNTFLRAVGAGGTANVATTAIAGGRQMICSAQPMMICNPAETPGNTGIGFNIDQWRGRQVRMLYQGGGAAQWAAGNFGYLSPGGNGANALRDALAEVSGANICYGPGVETEPGLTNGARTALNVRFGMYENPGFGGASNRTDPDLAPDVTVRSMPRDTVFTSNRFGNGIWNCAAYWSANFPGAAPANCTAATSASTLSRYDMFNYEIDNSLINATGTSGVSGRPPFNAANAIEGRRVIYIAVINCVEQNINGREQDVPVVQFLKVFLTEPVALPSGGGVEIIGEIIDVVEVGADDAVLREVVQLYR